MSTGEKFERTKSLGVSALRDAELRVRMALPVLLTVIEHPKKHLTKVPAAVPTGATPKSNGSA
jgi:hypothetical protein